MEANQKQPLGVTAYNEIYRRIMTLEYAPGQQLEEKMLMEALDIGRTPIREALLRLSADFMIESVPQKGFVVRQLTIQNIRAAFTLKYCLGSSGGTTNAWPRFILKPVTSLPRTMSMNLHALYGRWVSRYLAWTPRKFRWRVCWPTCSKSLNNLAWKHGPS